MLSQDHFLPFELLDDGQWGYFILFPEFKPYNVAALKEFESRDGGSDAAVENSVASAPPTAVPGVAQNQLIVLPENAEEDEDDDDGDEEEDYEIKELNENFERGRFKVIAGYDDPTPNQVRGAIFLAQRKQQIFRILIDHIYAHYNENRDAFRDFFNGEPDDRELLFPQLTSPFGLMRLIRLMEIEVSERALNGKSFITFYFDTTWEKEDLWEVTLCGEQIVSQDLPLLPIQLAAGSGWEQVRTSGKGWRFVEFAYGGTWTGIYRVNPTGTCVSHTECPVCGGPQILDATMITAIREAPRSHMLASLVHMLALKPWIQNGLKIVGPISYLLGWTWNPMFYWVTLVVSGLAGITAYLDAGWRRTVWVWIAVLEGAFAWLALSSNRTSPTLDAAPSWTVLEIFSQFVWTTTAAITVTWFYFLIGMAKHSLLRRAIWHLATFGILQVVALTFVAQSEYSPLHLLWFTPLTLLGTVLIAGRHLYASFQKQIRDSLDQGPHGGDPGMNWQQILDQISKGNRTNSVFESRPEKKDDPASD